MRLGVAREPDLACNRAADHRLQLKVRASRHRHAGGKLQAADPRPTDGHALERAVEPVAHAGLRDDALRVLLAERAAQLGDGVGDHVLDRRPPLPDGFEQLVLGYHLACVRQQARQDLQRLALHVYRQPRHAQLEPRLIELGRAKPISEQRRGRGSVGGVGHGVSPFRLFFGRCGDILAQMQPAVSWSFFPALGIG